MYGETILLPSPKIGAAKLLALMKSGANPVESCLTEDKRGMHQARRSATRCIPIYAMS